jgi:hypothetical protein
MKYMEYLDIGGEKNTDVDHIATGCALVLFLQDSSH